MIYRALDSKNHLRLASKIGSDARCPVCGEPLDFAEDDGGFPCFAHRSTSECPTLLDYATMFADPRVRDAATSWWRSEGYLPYEADFYPILRREFGGFMDAYGLAYWLGGQDGYVHYTTHLSYALVSNFSNSTTEEDWLRFAECLPSLVQGIPWDDMFFMFPSPVDARQELPTASEDDLAAYSASFSELGVAIGDSIRTLRSKGLSDDEIEQSILADDGIIGEFCFALEDLDNLIANAIENNDATDDAYLFLTERSDERTVIFLSNILYPDSENRDDEREALLGVR